MARLFLRRAEAPDMALGPLGAAEVVDLAPSAADSVTLAVDEAPRPLGEALRTDARLRKALLAALPMPALARYARVRPALIAGLLPLLALLELDRELLRVQDGAGPALLADGVLAATVASELARKIPRYPLASAVCLAAAAARLARIGLGRCAHGVAALVLVSGALTLACAVAQLWLAPGPRRVAEHLRRALGLASVAPARGPTSRGYVAYALATAAGLPFLLWAMRESPLHVAAQTLAFLAYGALAPFVGRRLFERNAPRRPAAPPLRAVSGAAFGLVLALALVRGGNHVLDAASSARRCADPATYAASSFSRVLEGRRRETGRRNDFDPRILFLTALVAPVAEELVYRGLLQRVLARRAGSRLAVVVSATAFGLAHLPVARFTSWQTVLLGLAFGASFEEAGLLASTLAHVAYNLFLSL